MQNILNNLGLFICIFRFMFVSIAMSGNTALPALKMTVIKKASEQVIADRIAHSVKDHILSVRNVINTVKNCTVFNISTQICRTRRLQNEMKYAN